MTLETYKLPKGANWVRILVVQLMASIVISVLVKVHVRDLKIKFTCTLFATTQRPALHKARNA